MKVQLTGASTLTIGEAKYKRGDVLEISERLFVACPDLFVAVEQAAKVTEPTITETTQPIEPTPEEEQFIQEAIEADTSTKEGKKKVEQAAKKVTKK